MIPPTRRALEDVALVLKVCVLPVAIALALAGAVLAVVLVGRSAGEPESTWPESDEFEYVETGADRFSVHDTNLDGWRVLVDHETGAQYIVGDTSHTICPMLDADGAPVLVAEAGR